MENFSSKLLGIAPHGVFVDSHFDGYNHLVSIQYVSENGDIQWLPITKKDGGPGEYIQGSNWAFLSFRMNGPKISQKKLTTGIVRFTAFWARKNKISLKNAKFNISIKKIENPEKFEWERGFLERQRNKPWQQAGTLIWTDEQPFFTLKDIESM